MAALSLRASFSTLPNELLATISDHVFVDDLVNFALARRQLYLICIPRLQNITTLAQRGTEIEVSGRTEVWNVVRHIASQPDIRYILRGLWIATDVGRLDGDAGFPDDDHRSNNFDLSHALSGPLLTGLINDNPFGQESCNMILDPSLLAVSMLNNLQELSLPVSFFRLPGIDALKAYLSRDVRDLKFLPQLKKLYIFVDRHGLVGCPNIDVFLMFAGLPNLKGLEWEDGRQRALGAGGVGRPDYRLPGIASALNYGVERFNITMTKLALRACIISTQCLPFLFSSFKSVREFEYLLGLDGNQDNHMKEIIQVLKSTYLVRSLRTLDISFKDSPQRGAPGIAPLPSLKAFNALEYVRLPSRLIFGSPARKVKHITKVLPRTLKVLRLQEFDSDGPSGEAKARFLRGLFDRTKFPKLETAVVVSIHAPEFPIYRSYYDHYLKHIKEWKGETAWNMVDSSLERLVTLLGRSGVKFCPRLLEIPKREVPSPCVVWEAINPDGQAYSLLLRLGGCECEADEKKDVHHTLFRGFLASQRFKWGKSRLGSRDSGENGEKWDLGS